MTRRNAVRFARLAALAVAWVFVSGVTPAAEPAELSRLFPKEAEVFVEKPGLSRLQLPAEVLAACRPDLSDLRLFTPDGNEVPFLVDTGGAAPDTAEITRSFELRIVEASRAEVRREDGPPLRRETYELDVPDLAPHGEGWALVVDTRRGEFVARVRLEGMDAAGNATFTEDGSVFRLRGARRAEKLRVVLPHAGVDRLRLTLETEHPFWLEPGLRLESARRYERGETIAVPLSTASIRSGGGRSVIELDRPRGIVPDLLRVSAATGTFDRRVEVWDQGPGAVDGALGSGRVFRVEGFVPVGESELVLRPARGDRLRVEIEDGDSPPLADPSFEAVIRRPSLIFSSDETRGGRPAAVLRFGGGRAHLPRYDLATLLPAVGRVVTGERAAAAALLYDPAAVGATRLGAVRDNPAYDGAPALAFAMQPGAAIDRRVFSHRRTLRVPPADEGLSRLRLAPADLAVLDDDLDDLRVADDASRQWPYLLERDAATELVTLNVEAVETADGRSKYRLRPPVSPLRLDRLVLDPTAGFFDRAFRLEATLPDGEDEVLLAGRRLVRRAGDPRPVSVGLSPVRIASLLLVVEDGNDAPLSFRSVQARAPLPELYVTAPEGGYALLLGAPDEDAPRYELERVRDVVLGVRPASIETGPLEDNPEFSLRARLGGQGMRQSLLLWGVLIAAVIVLALLTLRLARRENTGE